MDRMPVVFVGHGSPMNSLEKNRFTRGWQALAASLPRPEAILCISAHWYGKGNAVSSAVQPKTLHDFYGFPEALYAIGYPAPGAPALAGRVASLFAHNIVAMPDRGLDHGAWSVLRYMVPQADIPVCQLSVNEGLSPAESYATGRMLRPLRESGVLILGSGNIVHNLGLMDWDSKGGYPWADAFDAYIRRAITQGRHADAIDYARAGESAAQAFAYRDHYDPLLYALGATEEGEPVRVVNDARVLGSMSMTSYRIG